MDLCPCGSLKKYASCCGLYIIDHEKPKTPEQLMRSRYTAYVLLNIDYIERTMKGPAAKDFNKEDVYHWASQIKWLELKILHAETQKNLGKVAFIARYIYQEKEQTLHEISEFHYENNQWYYVDGQVNTTVKSERNAPCPCGSQKKYKKCCYLKA